MPEGMPEFDGSFNPEEFGGEFDPEAFAGERPSFEKEGAAEFPARSQSSGKAGYGTADIDAEYEEVKVTVGISDDDYVEITSGLNVGDVVVVDTANLASSGTTQYGMMGGGMMPGGMMGGGMSGGMMGGPPSGMGGGPMGR